MRAFSSRRRAKVLVLGCLLVWFASWRWLQRLEPWDSDDATLFEISAGAASGAHWLFGTAACVEPSSELSHQALRTGLLPVSVPAILAFGAGSTAYYLVPFLFSLVGFVCVGWVAWQSFGAVAAVAVAALHAAWPFELAHGSVFLTDLPSASMALASLCLIEVARTRGARRGRLACALLAGLAATESYLLRSNVLVLIAPAYLVFLWRRDARPLVAVAAAVLGLGILAEQGLFVWRGLGWGYGWKRVHLALEGYSEFLPVYSWSEFLIRQLRHQFTSFGRGATGALAALLLLGSLFAHALLLRHERRPLLLAIAAFGAFTWLIFSFSIYEWVDGGVRAMAPTSYRYIQPFTYSSVLAWAWLWCFIRERKVLHRSDGPLTRVTEPHAKTSAPLARRSRGRAWGVAGAVLPLVLFAFSVEASLEHLPPLQRESDSRQLFRALRERAARDGAPVEVAGLERGLRVPRILCCGEGGPVDWRGLTLEELDDALQREHAPLILRNIPRELSDARYLDGPEQARYRTTLARLDDALWNDYALVHVDGTYALFESGSRPPPRSPVLGGPVAIDDSLELARPGQPACRLTRTPEGARLELAPAARQRRSCHHASTEDSVRVPAADQRPSSDYVLRVTVDYQLPLSLAVEVIQHDGVASRRQSHRLLPGTSYVPVRMRAGTQAAYVVYRVNGASASGAAVSVNAAQWSVVQR